VHIENWNTNRRGLRAYAKATLGTNYGVVGALSSSDGYGGYFYNTASGDGLYGEGWYGVYGTGTSQGVHGHSDDGYGVYAYSTNGFGVGAATANASHNYGVYTADNLYALNFHSLGAQMQVVQNIDTQVLEQGDVVAFASIAAGDPPVLLKNRTNVLT
jgi:hypothetical protein